MAESKGRKFVGISMQSYDLTSGMNLTPLGVVLTDDGKETLDNFKTAVSSSVLSEQRGFLFATSDGHYISEELSRALTVADIVKDGTVYITKQHDPSRDPPILFGVVAQPGDLPMGYFTCSMNAVLSTARVAILEQVAHKETLEKLGFLFLYEKWPVSTNQESVLALYDILDRKQVFIQFKLGSPPQLAIPVSPSLDSKPTAASLVVASLATSHKRVYLSYVSDEASTHADALQSALKKLGLKVYTEQSNQGSGESSSSESSEQEYSNKFIQKAAVFVPIVSSRYGETSITNLEVKYADSLEKFIIPLNLNLHWPPNCLAVQFASVNYIRWKTKEPVEKEASTMAEGIVEVMQMNLEALNSKPSKPFSKRQSSVGLSDEKSLVVIICHTAQASFLEHVKEVLQKKNYTVCTTLELFEDSGVHISNSGFQKKVRDCCLVICIISKRFCSSMSCEQLVYYCQHRKKIIPVMYEDVEMPYWVSMLVGSEDFIDGRGHTFDDLLCKNVKLALSPTNISINRRGERETKRLQQELFSRLPDGDYIYISGGAHFYSTNGEAICKLLGKELAKLKSVVLVTGGFFGIGDTVAKSFEDKRKKLGLPINLYHTMAVKDPADRSRQTRQKEDGTMEPSPYGKSIFLGNSVRQCGTISTRVFNICILIEGGPSAAYEVQQFTWNGAMVIPVKSTGGAAGGKFLVPSSIYQRPQKVSESDWSILSNDTASVEDTVASLVRIVQVCFQITNSKKEPLKKN